MIGLPDLTSERLRRSTSFLNVHWGSVSRPSLISQRRTSESVAAFVRRSLDFYDLSITRAVLRSAQVDVELLSLATSPAGSVLLALGLCFFMGGRPAPQLDGALSLDMALREYRGANTSLRTRYEALAAARERLRLWSRLEGRLRWLSGRREVE